MSKSRIKTFIEKISQTDQNDPRTDSWPSGWYFPGHGPNSIPEEVPPIPHNSQMRLSNDEMVQLIEDGIAETERESAIHDQELGSIALSDTVQRPNTHEA